ncbi:MAG: AraC family transcriptional regulator [Cyclobacteriaceae bacterium]
MKNETQLERYKNLLDFIDQSFKEDINIQKVERVCHYSYRNINRIFQALHNQTIGKYIKRLRLEKAAEYLKYSDITVSKIAYQIGFSDVSAFSKAFKNRFHLSPKTFRERQDAKANSMKREILSQENSADLIDYKIEILPDLEILYLEYRGAYNNLAAINRSWEQLIDYIKPKGILTDNTIFLAEILDDNEISDEVNCRYNAAIVLEKPLEFEPDGLFRTKQIKRHKYTKFIHQGKHEASWETYQKIYACWLTEINFSLADLPTLEFYLNDESDTRAEDLITEIYIPIQ